MQGPVATYQPLPEPVPLTEQVWPDGTVPLVCTLTLAFMHEQFISQCIEGILMQRTTFPVEIVMHEDASTDRTADIIRSYESRYPRLFRVVYQQENTFGQPDRYERKKPLRELIRGKYQASCEGDDYWTDPLKIQMQVEALEADPAAVGCFTNGWNEREGVRTDYIRSWLKNDKPASIVVLEDLLGRNYVPTASIVYRRNARQQLPASVQFNALGDQALHVQLLLSGHYIYLPRHTCVRRVHAGGIISMKDAFHKLEVNIRSLDAIAELLEGRSTAVVHARMAGFLDQVVPVAARRGEVAKAKQYLARLRATPGVRLGWRRNLQLQLFVTFPRLMDRYTRFRKRRRQERPTG